MNIEKIPGYIIWIKSLKSENIFPHIIFSADVDFVTSGMISLTSKIKNEIVVSKLSFEELNSDGNQTWVKRINSELSRNDLKKIDFIRYENNTPKKKFFESVESYLKRLKPNTNYYQDIHNSSSESIQVSKQSVSEFIKDGGNIILHKFY